MNNSIVLKVDDWINDNKYEQKIGSDISHKEEYKWKKFKWQGVQFTSNEDKSKLKQQILIFIHQRNKNENP